MRRLALFPVTCCLAAALLFGASTPISKALLGAIGPFTLAGLLYLGAALAVLPFALRGGSRELRRDRRQRRRLGAAVMFGGVAGPVLLLFGLRASPAASVSLWLNLEVVATVILAGGFFRENLDLRTVLGAVSILLGGILLAAPAGVAGLRAGAWVALACVCWGLDNNLTALVGGFTPPQTTAVKGLIAGSVNLTLGMMLEGRPSAGAELAVVPLALLVGGLGYGLSIVLLVSGGQQLGASRSQILFSISPFAGVALAWTFFREPVLASQGVAVPFMIAGLTLALSARHEHEHAHEPMRHTHSHRHDDGHHGHEHPGLPAGVRHTHPHSHEPVTHSHPHAPDIHHRHEP
jgi:drug/metabolite transporter (DMT)-like permease